MMNTKKAYLVAAGLAIFSPFATASEPPEQQNQAGNLVYVGSNGRVAVGFDTVTKLRGEAYWVFLEDSLASWIGEGWTSGSAGGLKLNYHWIPDSGTEKPISQSVRKIFMAVDQNNQHDQKFTLGGGLERENLFFGAYASASLSGRRTISDSTSISSVTIPGIEPDGRQYTQDVLTSTHLRIYERPYDYGLGTRVGRYFNQPLIRLSGGLDYEWGRDSTHQTTLSVMLEKFIANTPHSFSVNAEMHQKAGYLEQNLNDKRLFFMYRYELGGKSHRPERESRMVEVPANTAPPAETSVSSPVENKPKIETRMVKTTATMLSDAFFKFDSDKLTPEAITALNSVVETLRKSGYSGNIHLTGHTCNIGTAKQNQKLSERRALSIKKYLAETGVVLPDTIITDGQGEDNPRYPNTKDSRYKNRRVDLEFVTFTEKLEDVELPSEPALVETAKPTGPAKVEWVREYIDTEPVWLTRALHNTTSHKQSVDVYRQQDREVHVTSSGKHYINRAPSAQNDAFSINQDTTSLLDVLANDSDPDGDLLKITSITVPTHGSASISGSKVSYTPVAGFVGVDNLAYTIADDKGATSTVQVTITVKSTNRPPVAQNDAFSINQDTTSLLDVLVNDSDPDRDLLKITSITTPAHGSASMSGSKVSYTPAVGFIGQDTFSYTIADDKGASSTAQATITVTSTNRPPVAVDDRRIVPASMPSLLDVLVNDSDPDGDALTIVSFTQPNTGAITLWNNKLVFTPQAGFRSTSFSYTISDSKGGTAMATVTLIDP